METKKFQKVVFPGFLSFCASKRFLLRLVVAFFWRGAATFKAERRASRRKEKHRNNTKGNKHARCLEQKKDSLPTTKKMLRENN